MRRGQRSLTRRASSSPPTSPSTPSSWPPPPPSPSVSLLAANPERAGDVKSRGRKKRTLSQLLRAPSSTPPGEDLEDLGQPDGQPLRWPARPTMTRSSRSSPPALAKRVRRMVSGSSGYTSSNSQGTVQVPRPTPSRRPSYGTRFTILNPKDCRAFASLIAGDPVISAFHHQDACCRTSDRYLIAASLVYFKRAGLQPSEFSRYLFFAALYLAHEVIEESLEDKWEILPWALGADWQHSMAKFIRAKNRLWARMDFRGAVSKAACDKVLDTLSRCDEFNASSVSNRVRTDSHGGAATRDASPTKSSSSCYVPFGPIWHHVAISSYGSPSCQGRRADPIPGNVSRRTARRLSVTLPSVWNCSTGILELPYKPCSVCQCVPEVPLQTILDAQREEARTQLLFHEDLWLETSEELLF